MSKPFSGLSICFALVIAIPLSGAAFAQSQPKAIDQLKKANEGERARAHVFDGRRDQGAVRADPAKKPSVVGVPASEFRPKVKVKPAAPPPSPR
jgi:hypothetical protein